MGHIEKRSNGRYRARYRDPNGKERSKTFHRKIDAHKFLAGMESDKAKGTWLDPARAKVRVGEWAADYIGSLHHLSDSTRAQRKHLLGKHILPAFSERSIGSIRQIDVQAWVNELVVRGLSPSTIRQSYQLFSRVMRSAVVGGLIPASPCQDVSLPRDRHKEMHFLSPAQVEKLARSIDPRFSLLVQMAAYTGLRWGELVGLKVKRVNFLKREIHVVEQLVEVEGKLLFKEPKTPQSRRTIAVPQFILDELAAIIQARGAGPEDLVFVGIDGVPLRGSNFRGRYWKPAVLRAGLPPDLRIHDLRHTCAALLIEAGRDLYDIMRYLGHSRISTTIDRYGHRYPQRDREIGPALERVREMGMTDAKEPTG